MTADVSPRLAGLRMWLTGLLLAVMVGGAAAFSVSFAVGMMVVLAVLYGFTRSGVQSELVVGLYWIAFDLYLTVFAGINVPGFFYPFYAAFFASFVLMLLRSRLRVHPPILWLYVGFMLVVAASFLNFADPIDFEVTQRVLAYIFGGLILFQVGSRRGVTAITISSLVASATVAGWVILRAAQGGFGYRADISVDQNVVAFMVGIGTITAAAVVVARINRRGSPWWLLGAALLLGVHLYAFLLLASRGVTIALSLATLALIVRAVRESPRNLLFVLLLAAVGTGAFFLPGGQGLVARFQGERVQSGGSRIPIWESTVTSYTYGNAGTLLLGHGFDSSKSLVRRRFVTLTSTHNAYVQMLYEFGILGLALFGSLHLYLIVRGWRMKNRNGLILYGVTWFLVGSNMSLNAPDGFLYWTALAFAMALGTWGDAPRPAAADGPARLPTGAVGGSTPGGAAGTGGRSEGDRPPAAEADDARRRPAIRPPRPQRLEESP